MAEPRISVILCGYNQAAYVAAAVESVLAQSFRDFELLVVDNGSTDGSPALLRAYASDPRVRLFLWPENRGVSARLNQAVAAARGAAVAFLYADDFFTHDKLERQAAALDALAADYGVVYGPTRHRNERTGVEWQAACIRRSGWVFRDLCCRVRQGPIEMGAALIRREYLLQRPFLESVFIEGEGIFFRLAPICRFQFLPAVTLVMRDHGANGGKAVRPNFEIHMATVAALEREPALDAGDRRCLRRHAAISHRRAGWSNIRLGGEAGWSRRRFADAVRTRPLEVLHPYVWLGASLSCLPDGSRRRVNGVGHWLRRSPANKALVEKFF